MGASSTLVYDARGQVIKTLHADGREEWRVLGEVPDLTTPTIFNPSPWTVSAYDANDLAPLNSSAEAAAVPQDHHYTPKTEVVDQMGRVIRSIERLSTTDEVVMKYEYDLEGNLLKVTDPLDRVVYTYIYDQAKRKLWTNHLDSGVSWVLPNAAGLPITSRDAKGARVLQTYDNHARPLETYSVRNEEAYQLTYFWLVMERFQYGVDANINSIGKPYYHYHTGGRDEFEYDYKGNVKRVDAYIIDDQDTRNFLSNPNQQAHADCYVEYISRNFISYDNLARPISQSLTHIESSTNASLSNTYYTQRTQVLGVHDKI